MFVIASKYLSHLIVKKADNKGGNGRLSPAGGQA
jgi:hypothetical protein